MRNLIVFLFFIFVSKRFLICKTTTEISQTKRVILNDQNAFKFILNPGNLICGQSENTTTSLDNNVELLMYVHTAVEHFTNRMVIRDSWAKRSLFPSTRLVFMMGFVNNSSLNDKLKLEMSIHNDIVQGDFIDTYRNITYKAMMAIKWISKYCSHVRLF